jgi:hypothetical protein
MPKMPGSPRPLFAIRAKAEDIAAFAQLQQEVQARVPIGYVPPGDVFALCVSSASTALAMERLTLPSPPSSGKEKKMRPTT